MSRAADAWAELPFFVDVFADGDAAARVALADGDAAARVALADAGAVALHFVRDSEAKSKWRFPLTGEETGAPAIALPVNAEGLLLSLSQGPLLCEIADLIAIPLDGARPLSFTGFTARIGIGLPDADGRVVLHGSGRAWLEAYLDGCRAAARETPDHLIAGLLLPFAQSAAALMIDPAALEWRVTRHDCVIPDGCREIVCPDSRALAETIDAAMRKPERKRPLPVVRGPSTMKQEGAAA